MQTKISASAEQRKKPIMLYDDSCRTCNVAKSIVDTTSAQHFLMMGTTTKEGIELAARHDLDISKSVHIIHPDNTIEQGAGMIKGTLGRMGFLGKLLLALLASFTDTQINKAYEWITRNRK